MQITNKELGIDNPWLSKVKTDLDIAIRSAVLAAGEGRKTKVSVTMNFDEAFIKGYSLGDTSRSIGVEIVDGGKTAYVGAQMNMFDDYEDGEE